MGSHHHPCYSCISLVSVVVIVGAALVTVVFFVCFAAVVIAVLLYTIQYNSIQYNITSFISKTWNKNNITTTVCTQNWDGWKGGGQKRSGNYFDAQSQYNRILTNA